MYSYFSIGLCGLLLSAALISAPVNAEYALPELTLKEARSLALEKEPGEKAHIQRTQAFREQSIADGELPDPQAFIGIQNLPSDSFDINQEAMTQLRLGLRQQFPRGDTLKLRSRQTKSKSEVTFQQSEIRRRQVNLEVSRLWLDTVYWQNYIRILNNDRYLFEQLTEITQSLYSLGRKDQEDVLRAQLELSKLDQRRLAATEKLDSRHDALSRWVGRVDAQRQLALMPAIQITQDHSDVETIDALSRHPEILKLTARLQVQRSQMNLAEQAYKPQIGVELGYGFRADGDTDRSDLLSAMVTFDMPIFTDNRQDRRLSAARSRALAIESERQALMNEIRAKATSLRSSWKGYGDRIRHYKSELLPQAEQQAEAALLAYQSDVGDFADVMLGYITVLNTKLDFLRLTVEQNRVAEELGYYLPVNRI